MPLTRKLCLIAEIGTFSIGEGEHRIALIAVQHRVRIPEAVGGKKPGVQIGGRSLYPYGQPEPPESGGIPGISRVVEGNLYIVAQLWRIPLQRFPGQEGKQNFLLLFGKHLRAERPGAGQLLDGHGEHFLVLRILRVKDRFQSGADAKREDQSAKPGQRRPKPAFSSGEHRHDRNQKDQDIQPVMAHQRHEAQTAPQQKEIPFLPEESFPLQRQLHQKQDDRQHRRRIQSVLGGTEHIHLDHRKKREIQDSRSPKPYGRALFSEKIQHPGETDSQHCHLEDHIAGDSRIIASEQLIACADDSAQEKHMQQRMMGGEPPLSHLVELLLRIIDEEARPHREQHDPPDDQEKEKDEKPPFSYGQALPAGEKSGLPGGHSAMRRFHSFSRHPFLQKPVQPLQKRGEEQGQKRQRQPQPPVGQKQIAVRLQPASQGAGQHEAEGKKQRESTFHPFRTLPALSGTRGSSGCRIHCRSRFRKHPLHRMPDRRKGEQKHHHGQKAVGKAQTAPLRKEHLRQKKHTAKRDRKGEQKAGRTGFFPRQKPVIVLLRHPHSLRSPVSHTAAHCSCRYTFFPHIPRSSQASASAFRR